MLKSLAGRTAIITGGSRGIGRGMAKRFADLGLNVVVVSRHLEEAMATASAIGPNAVGLKCDVADEFECKHMAEIAMENFGSIDILCANAGIFPAMRLGEMTGQDFDSVIATNLRGTFLSVSACLPAMRKARWGRIVITSSITGPIKGHPGWSHAGASKAGQLGFMRSAALELAPLGITINAIMPGNIATEGLDEMGPEYLSAMTASIPMGRLGSIDDIANAALYFSSEEAGFITGQTLVVDGGQVLPESASALEGAQL